MSPVKKIVLAYSGGLDTSVILPWLKDNYPGCQVIAFAAELGQGDELEGIKKKALATGADKCIIKDLRQEFAEQYCFPMLKSGAVYEGQYLLGTSIARPSSPNTRSRSPTRRMPTPSPTAPPARATTKSASN